MLGTVLISLVVGLLPVVDADVYKLKLQQLPPNPTLESTSLAAKYGAFNPLAVADGGHKLQCTSHQFVAIHYQSYRSDFLLLDYINAQYFTEISIGTPPQIVRTSCNLRTPGLTHSTTKL